MVKSRPRCTCGRSRGGGNGFDRAQYPAGIQKEDLLWAYFVMRMICEVLSDPDLLKRIQDRAKSGPATMFDLAMMCCATKNPDAFRAAAEAAKAQNTANANKSPQQQQTPQQQQQSPQQNAGQSDAKEKT